MRTITCYMILVALATLAAQSGMAARSAPVVFTISFPSLDGHVAQVDGQAPTDGRDTVELMMPIWSPGFYRIENYATKVTNFTATAYDHSALTVTHVQTNRWRIQTGGRASVCFSYQLACTGRSVTTDWVGTDFVVLNGPATFVMLAEPAGHSYEVKLTLPTA